MSFLSTAFLMALPLVAAPLILHFFDRRRKNVIEWGAMQFLLEASTRKTQARRLKQWLLLLMRMAAIAGLILALARPMLPNGYLGAKSRGETILVLDNSMSMLREVNGVSSIETAVQKALAEVADIPARERIRLLATSPYPVWLANTEAMSIDQFTSKLKQLKANQGQSDLLSALFTAVQTEHDPTDTSRRIVIVTDGQAGDWRTEDTAGWQRFRNVLSEAAIPTNVEIVWVEETNQQRTNVALERLSIRRSVGGHWRGG